MKELTNSELQKLAPPVFAKEPANGASKRYLYINTREVLNLFREQGWVPVDAGVRRKKTVVSQRYAPHLVRLRHESDLNAAKGYTVLEAVLFNSHDRTASFRIFAGLFRLVCSNGLVVSDQTFEQIHLTHNDYLSKQVHSAVTKLLESLPVLRKTVATMREKQLDDTKCVQFASAALASRWPDAGVTFDTPEWVLEARRPQDKPNDAWHVYNRVQENILKGGIVAPRRDNRQIVIKPLRDIARTITVNQALWASIVSLIGMPTVTDVLDIPEGAQLHKIADAAKIANLSTVYLNKLVRRGKIFSTTVKGIRHIALKEGKPL